MLSARSARSLLLEGRSQSARQPRRREGPNVATGSSSAREHYPDGTHTPTDTPRSPSPTYQAMFDPIEMQHNYEVGRNIPDSVDLDPELEALSQIASSQMPSSGGTASLPGESTLETFLQESQSELDRSCIFEYNGPDSLAVGDKRMKIVCTFNEESSDHCVGVSLAQGMHDPYVMCRLGTGNDQQHGVPISNIFVELECYPTDTEGIGLLSSNRTGILCALPFCLLHKNEDIQNADELLKQLRSCIALRKNGFFIPEELTVKKLQKIEKIQLGIAELENSKYVNPKVKKIQIRTDVEVHVTPRGPSVGQKAAKMFHDMLRKQIYEMQAVTAKPPPENVQLLFVFIETLGAYYASVFQLFTLFLSASWRVRVEACKRMDFEQDFKNVYLTGTLTKHARPTNTPSTIKMISIIMTHLNIQEQDYHVIQVQKEKLKFYFVVMSRTPTETFPERYHFFEFASHQGELEKSVFSQWIS